jgi:hypothetical protein
MHQLDELKANNARLGERCELLKNKSRVIFEVTGRMISKSPGGLLLLRVLHIRTHVLPCSDYRVLKLNLKQSCGPTPCATSRRQYRAR